MKRNNPLLFLLFCVLSLNALARDVTIVYRSSDSIRDVSQKYLKDADYWIDILNYNGETLNSLESGDQLVIPVSLFIATFASLKAARVAIENANTFGASIFVHGQIAKAEMQHEKARLLREESKWEEALKLADKARRLAVKALKETKEMRLKKGVAKLEQMKGKVGVRRTSDNTWNSAKVKQDIFENDRIRTLSGSTASVKFNDGSMLKLSPNSQAVVRSMSNDVLSQQVNNNVSILVGDIQAVLSPKNSRKKFSLSSKEVNLTNSSKNFWVSREVNGQEIRVSNFDGTEMEFSILGQKVRLDRDEGVFFDKKSNKPIVVKLLSAPKLLSPKYDVKIYSSSVYLEWQQLPRARNYWLEVARDRSFSDNVIDDRSLRHNKKKMVDVEKGIYYWRVLAIDEYGLPGPKSKASRFVVAEDTINPYLVVRTPRRVSFTRENVSRITGSTEKNIKISVNGDYVDVRKNGEFEHTVPLVVGDNVVNVMAVDSGENTTVKTLKINFIPDDTDSVITYDSSKKLDAKTFLTNNKLFTLSGYSKPGWKVSVKSNSTSFKNEAVAGDNGKFIVNLVLEERSEKFSITTTSSTDFSVRDEFRVVFDNVPPKILLDKGLSQVTNKDSEYIRGCLEEGEDEVSINDVKLRVDSQNCFARTFSLEEGENHFMIVAEDKAGNEVQLSWLIRKDSKGPVLKGKSLNKVNNQSGVSYEIVAYADDDTDLKKTAEYTVVVNGEKKTGLITYDSISNKYHGVLRLPNIVVSSVKWQSLSLEDYLGNASSYVF